MAPFFFITLLILLLIHLAEMGKTEERIQARSLARGIFQKAQHLENYQDQGKDSLLKAVDLYVQCVEIDKEMLSCWERAANTLIEGVYTRSSSIFLLTRYFEQAHPTFLPRVSILLLNTQLRNTKKRRPS